VMLSCCAVLLGVLAFAALAIRLFPYTMDDSYITFRYASNLAAGQGLVFIPGEQPRAEGITSPLYAAILSLATLTGRDIVPFSKWLGLLAAFVTAGLVGAAVYRLSRSLTSMPRVSAVMVCSVGAAYFLTNPYLVGNAVSGMETSLTAMAFAGFLFLVLKMMSSGTQPTHGGIILTGLVATLVHMLRPEMGLSVAVVLATAGLMSDRDRRPLFRSLAFFLLLGAVYYLLRFLYYGLPLPLPFYVKQAPLGQLAGLGKLESYFRYVILLLPLVVVGSAFALGPHRGERKWSCAYLLAVLVGWGAQLAYYATIKQTMGTGYRFFQPIAVERVILAFVGVGIMYQVALQSRLGALFSLPVLFCALGTVFAVSNVRAYQDARSTLVDGYAGLEAGIVNIGRSMKAASQGTRFRIAMFDCGAIPFYTGFSVVDLGGLNDRAIALAHKGEAARNEIAEKKPQLVVLVSKKKHDPTSLMGWERLSNEDVKTLGYSYVGTMTVDVNYHYLIYSNGDSSVSVFLDRLALTGVLDRGSADSSPERDANAKRAEGASTP